MENKFDIIWSYLIWGILPLSLTMNCPSSVNDCKPCSGCSKVHAKIKPISNWKIDFPVIFVSTKSHYSWSGSWFSHSHSTIQPIFWKYFPRTVKPWSLDTYHAWINWLVQNTNLQNLSLVSNYLLHTHTHVYILVCN